MSCLGDIQVSPGRLPVWPGVGNLFWPGGWSRWSLEDPSNPYNSVILWNNATVESLWEDTLASCLQPVFKICCVHGSLHVTLLRWHIVWYWNNMKQYLCHMPVLCYWRLIRTQSTYRLKQSNYVHCCSCIGLNLLIIVIYEVFLSRTAEVIGSTWPYS